MFFCCYSNCSVNLLSILFVLCCMEFFSYASSSTLHSCEPVSQSAGGQSFGLERSLELASLFYVNMLTYSTSCLLDFLGEKM